VVAAVQAHSGRAETAILAIPPAAAKESVAVEDVAEHLTTDGPSVVVDDELQAARSTATRAVASTGRAAART
jgi:hypothetical protein